MMGNSLRYLTGEKGRSGFGSKSTAEDVTRGCSLHSKTAIITGATSGIGEETARVLAKRGARLIMPARNVAAAHNVKARIEEESPDAEIIVLQLDLSSFASIRNFFTEFESLNLPLNILINNAGRYCYKFELSQDGFEMSFATNHLGHFLLTKLLLGKMMETANETGIEGRIVNVSSELHRYAGKKGLGFHDLRNSKSFGSSLSYAQSKLANILHVKELAVRLRRMKANVTANAVHPGIVKTNMIGGHPNSSALGVICFLASKLLKSLPQAAATTCYAATSSKLAKVCGEYLADCNVISCLEIANDPNRARQLWTFSETAVSRSDSKGKDFTALFLLVSPDE